MTGGAAYARDPSGLTQLIEELRGDGFRADMSPLEGGHVRCSACGATGAADAYHVVGLRRTEGASDPADMAAVVSLTCPSCRAGGILVAMYGPEASAAEADVLAALPAPDEVNTADRSS